MNSPKRETHLEELYAAHATYVRRCLRALGVPPADLDDVTQEVFLVVHSRQDQLEQVAHPDLWLREICRRVAAGYRRRAHRRREVYVGPPQNLTSADADEALGLDPQVEDEERLHHALGKLDDESRDLIALHSGNLPLVDVAELVEHDRKTVRKRLQIAMRRLQVLLGRGDAAEPVQRPSQPPPSERSADTSSVVPREVEVLVTTPAITVGLLSSVVIAVWPAEASLEALEGVQMAFAKVLERTPTFAYLAIVEANTRPPTLEARKKIVELLGVYSTNIVIYATALQGGLSWIARPIMSGLSLLARPPFPMEFFSGTTSAATWLCANHPGAARAGVRSLTAASEEVRELAFKTAGRT